MRTPRSVIYRGHNRRGGAALPAHAHPLVQRFFILLNARCATFAEVAERTDIGVDTLRFWRSRHVPRLDLFDAALNALGFELTIVKRRQAARRCPMSALGLTTKQRETLEFIEGVIARTGVAPTYREIAAGTGVRLSRVGVLIAQLKERGAVDYAPRRSRSLLVLGERSTTLPAGLAQRLARFCAANGESQSAVIHDAVALHLDAIEGAANVAA